MKGNDIKLLLDEEVLAASTNCAVELTHSPIPVTPLPGDDDDDGWQHYRPGSLSWSLSADCFYTENAHDLLNAQMDGQAYTADIPLDGTHTLSSGEVFIQEMSITASVHGLAKFTAKFLTPLFPTLS